MIRNIARLRRAERVARAAPDVGPVRRDLEAEVGPTVSRARAARVLGVSQTAIDRWVGLGELPTVITPTGRVEIPLPLVVELLDSIDELRDRGRDRHLLAAALHERRTRAGDLRALLGRRRTGAHPPRGHSTAEARSLAHHRVIAERLDDDLVEGARARARRWRAEGRVPVYAQRWEQLLANPLDEIAQLITRDSQEARDLRQNSPFGGALNEHERRQVIELVG